MSALFTKPQYSWSMPKCRSKIGKTLVKNLGFVPAVTEGAVCMCQVVEGNRNLNMFPPVVSFLHLEGSLEEVLLLRNQSPIRNMM